ncbi:hypothetical protein Ptr86124_007503 [Pyrenophora tritici-repentis]|uniref:Uncharacterized protein n=1 Tax=Pyrenophora tritici-repentis TaxID=45151 RepID=A0A922NGC6_9PLEO|nr:hypothetical protein Ptr86124_007503 [Pyrenophora tritici-repentis]
MAIAYDTSLSVEEQASINVDALVNDSDNEPLRVTPITPISSQLFDQGRRSTPTIPPGFTIPAIPKTVMEGPHPRPGSLLMSWTNSSNITPAIPVVPVTPIQASTPNKATKVKPKSDAVEPATPKATSTPTSAVKPQPTTPSKTVTKEAVVVPQTPKEPTPREASRKAKGETVQTPKSTPETRRSISEIVAKDASKAKENSKKIQPPTQTTPKKDTQKEPARTPAANVTPTSTKRQPPGKLDIPSATKASIEEESVASTLTKADSQTKNTRSLPATATVSVPPSPAAATGSPIKRTAAPRTLRVIATPKAEVPSPLSTASAPSLPQIPTVDKLRSRQASIASINQPGTPASDLISDTASITSTSMSRASSPPPVGKIGSAPMRKKTKSQAKKDRQERKKQIEEEQLEDNKSDVEVMQAPIIGRKKKAKKPTANPKPIAAAFKSQPASPKPATVEEEHVETPAAVPRAATTAKVSTPEPEPEPEAEPEQSKERREYNAQAIIADLQRTGELLASTLEFFKPLSSSLTHVSRTAQSGHMATPPDLKLHFSQADLDALAKKKPVRLNSHDGRPDSRTLITPKGKFFYGLSEELEAKALDLEKHIEALKGHARFHPRRQTAHGHSLAAQSHSNDVLPAIATALQEAGKKLNTNGGQQMPKLDGSSAMLGSTNLPLPPVQAQDVPIPQVPPPPQQQTPADAGAYLNQYVLPRTDNPPPNQPRPEMAAVGGPPGAGTANMSVNANKFAKAAKAVVEGGAVGSTEIDGVGVMAADRLGGVFVQGLEALVGAGLGYDPTHDFSRSTSMKPGAKKPSLEEYVNNMDMKTLINAMEAATGMEGVVSSQWRGSLLSVGEAEQAVHAARKEHDVLEKKLTALVKKNRKLALGGGK